MKTMMLAMTGLALAVGLAGCCGGGKSESGASTVTMRGQPVTLLGTAPQIGDKAPAFRAVDGEFKPVALADLAGQTVLISSVPSLDTGVCALQTRKFNAEAVKLPRVKLITISADLPFAQKRFCKSLTGGPQMLVLSDCAWREFGANYGLLIDGRGLLARSVWVIGPDGVIVYRQIVPELGQEPDYAAALKAAAAAGQK